jgi:hypothetical protein
MVHLHGSATIGQLPGYEEQECREAAAQMGGKAETWCVPGPDRRHSKKNKGTQLPVRSLSVFWE